MEQQKFLWTILSVAVLVLVLLGAGMFIFLPSDNAAAIQEKDIKPVEWAKADTVKEQQPKTEPKAKALIAVPETPKKEAAPFIVPPKPAVKEPAPETKTKLEVKQPEKKVVQTKPAETPKPATQTKPAVQPKQEQQQNTVKQQPAQTTAPASGVQFWIQVGSFSAQQNAENVKKSLEEKGFKAVVQSVAADGKSLHKVKAGPFATKAEAEKQLPGVKAIKGFEKSYITTK